MLEVPKPKKAVPPPEPTPEPEVHTGPEAVFIARFEGFEGTLLELAVALRAGKVAPVQVPLLELTRAVLERYYALREDLDVGGVTLDVVSETLPHLAGVIELKARMLLPRQPTAPKDEEGEDTDADLDDVLEGVEALAKLEGAIAFLRERRRERARMLVANTPPIKLPRRARPIGKGLGELIAAAKRKVREVNMFDLAIDRLTLPQALERLREFGKRLKRYFFKDVPAHDWGERTVLFSAMLEGVRAGELEVTQPEQFGEIEIRTVKAEKTGSRVDAAVRVDD